METQASLIEIVDQLITSSKARLPVFNATAAHIQQKVAKSDPDPRLIEKIIVSDPALTAEVLRVSNSSFYLALNQVVTVRNAIVRLGLNEVSNIVMMLDHESHFRSKDPFLNQVMRQLWRHSLGTALAAHWLARHCGLHGVAHEAFFAGLLHDVGKLFILTVIEDLMTSQKSPVRPSTALMMEAMDHLHTGHGFTLMMHWNLPQKYAAIARDHHSEPPDAENILALPLQLANSTCHKMGIGPKHDASLVLMATAEANELHLSEVDLAEMMIMLEDSQVFTSN
jgi:HD-like signal output (HDOD) protein